MYHWTVPIISVILIFSYAIPGRCVGFHRKWQEIGIDLKNVSEREGLKLYTAGPVDHDTCGQSILSCYVQELKALVEEINLIGDEDAAQRISDKIYEMEVNGDLYSLQDGGCKKCEEYEEKPIEEFMEDFKTLTQIMQT
ncbi:interleukin-15 isoform X2 [Pyxicephalus adspersus]|uniref:interleukin-15 isoform X2 n=1 Tax=Pyxicephalus adspersus TaxID=30357 RepID=UPI003B58C334